MADQRRRHFNPSFYYEAEHNYNAGKWGVPGHPQLFTIFNKVENGRELGPRRVGEHWHTDMCYATCPPRATMLYAIEVPNLHGPGLGARACMLRVTTAPAPSGLLTMKRNG